MFDMSWGEVMVIGAVALIVIGPKDLPRALRTVGNMIGKVRRLATEFQGQFSEAMREAELEDVKRQIQGVTDSVGSINALGGDFNPIQTIRDELKGAIDGKPADAKPVDAAPAPGEVGPPAPDPLAALPVPALPSGADPFAPVVYDTPAPAETPRPAAEPVKQDEKA